MEQKQLENQKKRRKYYIIALQKGRLGDWPKKYIPLLLWSLENSVNQWHWLYHDAGFSECLYDFLYGHICFHSEYDFSKKSIMKGLSNKEPGIFTKFSLKWLEIEFKLNINKDELKG